MFLVYRSNVEALVAHASDEGVVTQCIRFEAESCLVHDIHWYLLMGCDLGLIGAGFSGILADESAGLNLIDGR
jgi:hypothetical protein